MKQYILIKTSECFQLRNEVQNRILLSVSYGGDAMPEDEAIGMFLEQVAEYLK